MENPEKLDELNSVKVTGEIQDWVNDLQGRIEECEMARTTWNDRQDQYIKKRYGIREKKSHPWPGSANFVLPEIDNEIQRSKSAYLSLVKGTPVCTFIPYGPEDVEPARKREMLFDWRMRTQVKFLQPYALGVDYALSHGFVLYKVVWKYETRQYTAFIELSELSDEVLNFLFDSRTTDEDLFWILQDEFRVELDFSENVEAIWKAVEDFRNGKAEIELKFTEVVADRPEVIPCNPRDDVFFPVETCDIQRAAFIDYRYWISKNELKKDMESGKYEEYDDADIDAWVTESNANMNMVRQVQRGTHTANENVDNILMHEVCTWYDVNGDGIDERVVINYPDAKPAAVLRFIENPYDHGQFPYVVCRREINEAQIIASRGIPALTDDFQVGMSEMFNQDVNAGTILTNPTVVVRKGVGAALRNLRYVPGQTVETENGAADWSIMNQSNMGQMNRFASIQMMKAWANERMGNSASGITSIQNMPGAGEKGKKTAREIELVSALQAQSMSLDLLIWLDQLAEVFYMIDALYWQFGKEEEEIAITNEKPVKISRREIQGRFNIVPNSRPDEVDPKVRLLKILSVVEAYRQDPDVKQYELKRWHLNEIDPRLAGKLLLSEDERTMRDQMFQAQQQAQKEQLFADQVKFRIISDNLDVIKEADLVPIQGKKFAPQ